MSEFEIILNNIEATMLSKREYKHYKKVSRITKNKVISLFNKKHNTHYLIWDKISKKFLIMRYSEKE